MRVVVTAIDKENSGQIRLDNRDAHLAYIEIETSDIVELAGPFLDADGNMCGFLLILSVDSMAEAEAWAANDPYAKAGLFAKVSLRQWKKVIG